MLTNDFRTILAAGTREAHERIQRELALEGDVTLARYVAYLRALHAVVRHVEHATARAMAALGLDAGERRKTAWLERDLRFFEAPPRPAPMWDAPGDVASRIGWAYVLEGATLGGRVLYKRLAPRWSLTPQRGAAFLTGYGERTAPMWQAFVRALDGVALDAHEKNACVAAARQAFLAIGEAYRESVAGADLGLARQDDRLGTPPEQAPERAVERPNPQQREESLGER